MKTDRQLLELAARAAGMELYEYGSAFLCWNPLKNDSDALRLAVKLGISITPYPIYAEVKHSVIAKQRRASDMQREQNPTEVIELYGANDQAATRRAIVRAAAAIGAAME